jgi:uncharacterized membrane protein YqjE
MSTAAPEPTDPQPGETRSLGQIVGDITSDMSTLVRQEIDLAKAEMAERGKRAGKGAGMLAAGAVVALLALGALTACVIAALDLAMATWLAALIVTVIYGVIAGVLAMTGRKQIREAAPPVPEQTIESVKEDVQWAKTRTRSATK